MFNAQSPKSFSFTNSPSSYFPFSTPSKQFVKVKSGENTVKGFPGGFYSIFQGVMIK